MRKIKISNLNYEIEVHDGENILQSLKNAGVSLENPCRGLGTCGKCKIKIIDGKVSKPTNKELELLNGSGNKDFRLACYAFLESDISIEIPKDDEDGKVMAEGYISEFEIDKGKKGFGFAVDIGTTTIVSELVDLSNGKVITSSSMINPQKKFGLDVLSRITHVVEECEKGIKELQDVLINGLNNLTLDNLRKSDIKKEEIKEYAVSANTTMMHTLLGEDVTSMGRFPYKPSYEGMREVYCESLGLIGGENSKVLCLPHVSAFIGADVVAGAKVSEITKRKGNILFIDIGTNGEIVLKIGDSLSCCSCAAGPALEGMNITSGVRASSGAIEEVKITENGIVINTIENKRPIGICGSGILASVRELLKCGILRENGAFIKKEDLHEGDYRYPFIGLNGKKRELILSKEPYIAVTQGDVRQVQLAKGAILSGFLALLKKYEVAIKDLDEVLIAGQFGAHLPKESLTGTGILPKEFTGKITYLGNTSMTGARMALLSKKAREDMVRLKDKMEYVELAVTDGYEDIFRNSMLFPSIDKKKEKI